MPWCFVLHDVMLDHLELERSCSFCSVYIFMKNVILAFLHILGGNVISCRSEISVGMKWPLARFFLCLVSMIFFNVNDQCEFSYSFAYVSQI